MRAETPSFPVMTAQQIFDAQNPPGTPAPNNVFQAVYTLGQALINNNQAGIQTATTAISAAARAKWNSLTLITETPRVGSSRPTPMRGSALRICKGRSAACATPNVASAATQLTTDQTALEAALSAHASLGNKSLFSYLG